MKRGDGETKTGLVAVVATGCPACENTKAPLAKAVARLRRRGVSARVVNAAVDPDEAERLDVPAYPTIMLRGTDGRVLRTMPWKDGAPSADDIVAWATGAAVSDGTSRAASSSSCAACAPGNKAVGPAAWGPAVWRGIHLIALAHPRRPTRRAQLEAAAFYRRLAELLPCRECSVHFAAMVDAAPAAVFASRDALFAWTVQAHNTVTARVHPGRPLRSVAHWQRHYSRLLA